MKKLFVPLLLLTIFVSSCQKEETVDTISGASINTTQIKNAVSAGNWRVSYYWDTNHDETTNFTSYVFTFNASGSVTAVKQGSTNVNGTWLAEGNESKTQLTLSFATPADFLEISDDWQIIDFSETKIKMQDVSDGNGGIDYLTIEKL